MSNYQFLHSVAIVEFHEVWKTVWVLGILRQCTYCADCTRRPCCFDGSLIPEYWIVVRLKLDTLRWKLDVPCAVVILAWSLSSLVPSPFINSPISIFSAISNLTISLGMQSLSLFNISRIKGEVQFNTWTGLDLRVDTWQIILLTKLQDGLFLLYPDFFVRQTLRAFIKNLVRFCYLILLYKWIPATLDASFLAFPNPDDDLYRVQTGAVYIHE